MFRLLSYLHNFYCTICFHCFCLCSGKFITCHTIYGFLFTKLVCSNIFTHSMLFCFHCVAFYMYHLWAFKHISLAISAIYDASIWKVQQPFNVYNFRRPILVSCQLNSLMLRPRATMLRLTLTFKIVICASFMTQHLHLPCIFKIHNHLDGHSVTDTCCYTQPPF